MFQTSLRFHEIDFNPLFPECPYPEIKFWLHPSLILPQSSMEFNSMTEVPDALILPAQKGISISLQCNNKGSITVHCVPRKFNQGSLTCSLASVSPSIAASKISKR